MGCNCGKNKKSFIVVDPNNECVMTDPGTGECTVYASSGQAARSARIAGLAAQDWTVKRL